MDNTYTAYSNLIAEVNIPENGILSRTLHNDDRIKLVLFGFDTGQELSEHTASMPAILHFIQGEATLTVGGNTMEAGVGTWAHMAANLPHSIVAKTPVVLVLYLLK